MSIRLGRKHSTVFTASAAGILWRSPMTKLTPNEILAESLTEHSGKSPNHAADDMIADLRLAGYHINPIEHTEAQIVIRELYKKTIITGVIKDALLVLSDLQSSGNSETSRDEFDRRILEIVDNSASALTAGNKA